MKNYSNLAGNGMSRRSFLTAAGIGTLGAAAASLGACTPAQTSSGDGDKLAGTSSDAVVLNSTTAQAKWAFEIPPDPIDEDQITETVEHDVVVVGAGPAGTFFAAAYGEKGGDAIVITKSVTAEGRGGTIFAVNSSFMRNQGEHIDADEVLKHEMFANSFNVDQDKWIRFFDHSGEAIDWMHGILKEEKGWTPYLQQPNIDSMGVISHVLGSHGMGSSENPKLDELEVSIAMAEYAEANGVEFRYKTEAVQLEKDGDRVVAVIAKGSDGSYQRYVGKKAVILATGDFTQDKEMCAKYCRWAMDVSGGVEKGDGHKMALWAGAAWQRNAAVPMINHNLGICNQVDGPFPGLVINKLGKRFGNEDSNTVFQGIAQMRQPEGMNYGLFNEEMARNVTWWNYGVNRDIPPMEPEEVLGWWDAWVEEEHVTTYAGAPDLLCYKADTIEELCAKFDLPTDEVMATVARYNEFAKNGFDEEYHKNPELLFPIENGPFYMFGSAAWNLVMCGGIRSNKHMQALNEQDEVVPGLYVLGMLVGDMYMSPYDFVCGGANLGSTCLTFGYLLANELSDGTLEA